MTKQLPPPKRDSQDDAQLRQLEALLQSIEGQRAVLGDTRTDEMLASVRSRLKALKQNGSQVIVDGSVGPGAAIGGEVQARDIAGHNVVHAQTYAETVIQQTQGPQQVQPPPGTGPLTLEANYLRWLMRIASRVPLGQLASTPIDANGDPPEVTLDAVYVELDTLSSKSVEGDPTGQHRTVSALEAVIDHPCLVVLGDPGSGKTTFVNYLTLCLAGERLYPDHGFLSRLQLRPAVGRKPVAWPHGALLPIRVVLRELAQSLPKRSKHSSAELLWKHITADLASRGLAKYAPFLQEALQQGRCMVMLDGLDEVPENTRRSRVRDIVADFVDAYGNNRFLVTCRVLSYTNPDWKLPGCPSFTLAPLGSAQVEAFVGAWYDALASLGELTPREARVKARQLQSAAAGLLDLAQNPMLLTVMAVVHTFKGVLPRERARLYEDCATLLLWRWQRTKDSESIIDVLETREERLHNGLCEVAFRAHTLQGEESTGSADIPQSELLRVLQRYLGGSWSKAEQFCEYVEERAGLLVGKGHGKDNERVFAFPHRSFQEFLAGSYLASNWGFGRQAVELVRQGNHWREVLLLAVGHIIFNQRNITRPLDAINLLCPEEPPESEDEHAWRAVWWAAEMLHLVDREVAEQDELIGRKAAVRVMTRLVELVKSGRLSPQERSQAADVLGRLGDPRPGVCSPGVETTLIPGGRFKGAMLRPFRIGCYPVTNAQFLVFVQDGGYRDSEYWTKAGWEWRKKAGDNVAGMLRDPFWGIPNRPVVRITWHEAVAFANWLAKRARLPYRLPTETEWERAAAGPDGVRVYPWGSQWHDGIANTKEAGVGHSTGVGIFPGDVTSEGVYDMGGNVWEWCSSRYVEGNKATDSRDDLDAPGPRILRGGSFDSSQRIARCDNRHWLDPDARTNMIGFRVALTSQD